MPRTHEVDARRRIAISGALAALGGLTLLPSRAAPAASRALAAPERTGGMALDQALALRRSVRSYGAQPLALAAVSQLLWAAQGTTSARGQRTAPSAGALYPLELHLLAARVTSLAEMGRRVREFLDSFEGSLELHFDYKLHWRHLEHIISIGGDVSWRDRVRCVAPPAG